MAFSGRGGGRVSEQAGWQVERGGRTRMEDIGVGRVVNDDALREIAIE
jgi:hypothetical protein